MSGDGLGDEGGRPVDGSASAAQEPADERVRWPAMAVVGLVVAVLTVLAVIVLAVVAATKV